MSNDYHKCPLCGAFPVRWIDLLHGPMPADPTPFYTFVRAAYALDEATREFGWEPSCIGEHVQAFDTAADAYRKWMWEQSESQVANDKSRRFSQ